MASIKNDPLKAPIIFLRLYWVRLLVIALGVAVMSVILYFLYRGIINFNNLESYGRQQIMAYMGFFFITGIFAAIIQSIIFLWGQWFLFSGGIMQFTANQVKQAKPDVKWGDVIGMESAKKEAWELVDLLKDRGLIKVIGGKIIKGLLMIGPPGCGKTYLAKAIATECGLPMLSAVGSEFIGIFVGQGTAQIKAMFKQARGLADIYGGCIIFIDEIDSIARPRMSDLGFGGAGISHNATINQILTELDGLRKYENNIVVIGATNASEYELDEALLRAGRFERKIYINYPNLIERKDLFDFYLKKVKVDPNINVNILARKTLWFSPADIDAMIRESGLIALRGKRDTISMKDLSAAYDRVIYGEKSNLILTPEDKKWVAYHEAGHAIMAYLIHPKDDVVKATIIPRRGALGFVSHRPNEEFYSKNREYFLAQIKISIASYVAENMTFGSTTSGVGGGPGSDFHTALSIARSMVWSYGMGKSGLIGDYKMYSYSRINREASTMMSSKTIDTLDTDVQDILQTCIKEVRDILTEKRDLLEYFSQELLKKEELEYDEIQMIFNKFNVKPLSGREPLPL